MEKDEYRKHFELEKSFWWFAGRRKIIHNILKSYKLHDRKLDFLDIGCGTGYELKVFQKYYDSIGIDLSQEALFFSKKRDLKKIVQADAGRLPFEPSSFDLITFFDVLYHRNIKNDIKVLHEAHRVLKKGGYILMTDSALNFLFSRHDLALHTRERYNKKSLRRRMEKAGFHIKKMSYFNFFLFFGITLVRLLEKKSLKEDKKFESDLKAIDTRINAILLGILKLEAFLIKHVNFPFGSSILCLAKKNHSYFSGYQVK